MKKQSKKIIPQHENVKAKHFVTEEEFIEHLNKVCPKYMRKYVLEFYEKFKKEDEMKGKNLTKDFFGKAKERFIDGKVYDYDLKKYLFQNQDKIGRADFFRFQFVNNVDKITLKMKTDLASYTTGQYSATDNTISILNPNINKSFDEFQKSINKHYKNEIDKGNIDFEEAKKYFIKKTISKYIRPELLRDTIRHELTHALTKKTICDGKFYEIMAQSNTNEKNDIYTSWPYMNKIKETGSEVNKDFISGLHILNELNTDIFANRDHQAVYNIPNKKPYSFVTKSELASIISSPKLKDKMQFSSSYLSFANINEFMKYANIYTKPEEFLSNSEEFHDKFSSLSKIWENTNDKVNNLLIKTYIPQTKQEEEYIKCCSMKHKLILLLGKAYKNYKKEINNSKYQSNSCYNKYAQASQAILFALKSADFHNKMNQLVSIEKKVNGKSVNKTYDEIKKDEIEAKKLMQEELDKVKKLSKWIIKPVINIALPVPNCNKFATCDKLSYYDLARNHPESLPLEVWKMHLESLVTLNYKLGNKFFDKDEFWKKEYASYQRAKALNKTLEQYAK